MTTMVTIYTTDGAKGGGAIMTDDKCPFSLSNGRWIQQQQQHKQSSVVVDVVVLIIIHHEANSIHSDVDSYLFMMII